MMIWATRGYCSVIDEVLGVNEFVPKDNSRKTIIHLFVSLFFQNENDCNYDQDMKRYRKGASLSWRGWQTYR